MIRHWFKTKRSLVNQLGMAKIEIHLLEAANAGLRDDAEALRRFRRGEPQNLSVGSVSFRGGQ